MIFLPEASDFIADNCTQGGNISFLSQALLSKDQSFLKSACESAKIHKIWVSVGYHEQCNSDSLVYNSQASNLYH